jgi:hypothetical protein
VAEADADAAGAAFTAARTALAPDHPDWRCELLRRPEARDGLATLMEVHAGLDAAALEALDRSIGQAMASWLRGPRQVECFDVIGPA